MTEEEISDTAVNFVKTERRKLIEKFANPQVCQPTEHPVSLFMAGSPGAGKTEVSKRLMEKFDTRKPIRIDADEIRELLPNYTGNNSHIFQRACSKGVDQLHDYAIKNNLNIILDGTFSSEKNSFKNITRSIKHGRRIEVYYIYQDPALAWKFTKTREAKEGRRISKEIFIETFIAARENVNKAKEVFGDKIELNLIVKDFDKNLEEIKQNISNVDMYRPKIYTVDKLKEVINV